MKTRTLIIISALLAALTSCGSAAQYASNASHQRYQDGVYYSSTDNILKPEAKEQNNQAVQVETTDTDPLVAKTKSSPIFMKSGEKVDTLFIPTDRTAKISLNGSNTTVTLYDNSWDTWHSYQPWYASSCITDLCTLHITGDILLGTITDGTTILGTTGLGIMGSHGAGAGVALGAVSR